jgi:septum site-determining protein MinC
VPPLWFSMKKTPSRKPIEIKISTVVAVSAILRVSDTAILDAAMCDMTGGESDYFDGEFTIIDLGSFEPTHGAIDWAALITLLQSYRLNPIAVRNATREMEADILAHGLSLDVVTKPRQETIEPAAEVAAEPRAQAAVPASMRGTMIIDTPVRAGQRIYARGCDLVVTAAVNNGAEIIADGSIHVYAPLRGRALAGASGDADARIFAMSMEPELVSIAGIYRTFENGFPADLAQHPAQIRLIGDKIDLRSMQAALSK